MSGQLTDKPPPKVAIVDYGLGNLFSVKQACTHVGMDAVITSEADEILSADGVIIPGVGAFGDAMASLTKLDLVAPLQDRAASGSPVVGICLGMQLLMSESEEFGCNRGLDVVNGPVVRLESLPGNPGIDATAADGRLKVPQIAWNQLYGDKGAIKPNVTGPTPEEWNGSPLEDLQDGEYMYFIHSYYVQPEDAGLTLSTSRYGGNIFCSSFRQGNVLGFQFHPERSGRSGLAVYARLKDLFADPG